MKTKIKILALGLLFNTTISFSQSLADAIRLTTNEQYDKAEAAFKTLLQSQPNNGEYLFYLGENYFKNDQLDKASESYQKAIELNATNPFGYVGLGKMQWYNNKLTEAKATFYKATALAAGKNATVLMKIAEVYTQADEKNFTEALTLLNQAAKLEPKNPEVYIYIGDVYLEQNMGTDAITNYEKAGSLDPKSVRAILRQGQVWNRARNYDAALKKYKEASLIDSSFAPAYREKAEIYYRAAKYNDAVAQYKRYLEINNECGALGRYAAFLNIAKMYKESIEAATKAMECDPNNIYLYRYKGRSEYETADYVNGLKSMNTFLEKAATNTTIKVIADDYEYRAKLYLKTNQDSLAIIDFKKAQELKPDKTDFYTDMANAYVKSKKYNEAIELYKVKMSKTKPSTADYFGLGRAYLSAQDFVNADSAFAKVTTMQPEYALGYLYRAKASSNIDSQNEKWLAQPYYETYITKVKPEDREKNKANLVEAYTYMGVYYTKSKKDICTAKAQYLKALELDPKNTSFDVFLKSKEAIACP